VPFKFRCQNWLNGLQGSQPENRIELRIIDNMIATSGAACFTEGQRMYREHPQPAYVTPAVLVGRVAARTRSPRICPRPQARSPGSRKAKYAACLNRLLEVPVFSMGYRVRLAKCLSPRGPPFLSRHGLQRRTER